MHFCIKCLKISEQGYDFMSERPDVHSFCGGCDAKVVQSICIDRDIEKRCEVFFNDISQKMNAFEDRVKTQIWWLCRVQGNGRCAHKIEN